MKRSHLLLVLLLALAACNPTQSADTTTTVEPAMTSTTSTTTTVESTAPGGDEQFPVTVTADNGEITVEERPEVVISLSSTATEMLFALGAGSQVVAVDEQSNHPAEAPITDLSGFTPNIEAILSFEPDLVVISFDPGDLIASLDLAGVDVISYGPASSLDDVYRQIEGLGSATGNTSGAEALNSSIAEDLDRIVEAAPNADGITYYHEIDSSLYTATSSTFIGQIYGLFGLENIADPADADGSLFGFPQVTSEFVVEADPNLIFLANTLYGESAETIAERPGWGVLSAVQQEHIIELDSDISSRWGPRVVEFAQDVADGIDAYVSQG